MDEVYGVINGAFTGFVVTVFFIFFWRPLVYSRLFFLYATALIIVFLIAARLVRRGVLRTLRARGIGVDRVLIVGSGDVGLTVMRNLMAQPELGFRSSASWTTTRSGDRPTSAASRRWAARPTCRRCCAASRWTR